MALVKHNRSTSRAQYSGGVAGINGGAVSFTVPAQNLWDEFYLYAIAGGGGGAGYTGAAYTGTPGCTAEVKSITFSAKDFYAGGWSYMRALGGALGAAGSNGGNGNSGSPLYLQFSYDNSTWTSIVGLSGGNGGRVSYAQYSPSKDGDTTGMNDRIVRLLSQYGRGAAINTFHPRDIAEPQYSGGVNNTNEWAWASNGRGGGDSNYNNSAGSGGGSPSNGVNGVVIHTFEKHNTSRGLSR
jgi:hypothetical protein